MFSPYRLIFLLGGIGFAFASFQANPEVRWSEAAKTEKVHR